MPRGVLFCFSDLGRNTRFINYADKLSQISDMRLFIFGFDETDIPRKLENNPNITIYYLYKFFNIPWFLSIWAFPLKFLFYFFQFLAILVNIRNVNFIISSTSSFTELLFSIVFTRVKSCKLIFDIENFHWFENYLFRIIFKRSFSFANFLISSNKGIQMILKISGFQSYVIPNLPDPLFAQPRKSKKDISQLLSIPCSSIYIVFPLSTYDSAIFKRIEKYSKTLQKSNKSFVFIICGSGKFEKEYNERVQKLSFDRTKFIFVPYQYDIFPHILTSCDLGIYMNELNNDLEIPKELLEMNISGIPIITFRNGCVSEIIKNEVNGFIVDNDEELIKLLKSLFIEEKISLDGLKTDRQNILKSWNECYEKAFDVILK